MIDVKKEMTFEEVKNFFSCTHEFTVEDQSIGDRKLFNIVLKDESPAGNFVCSSLMSRVNIQQLIRKIHQLTYNMTMKNYD